MDQEQMQKMPYLARGVREIPTTSSVLVSSSRFLNSPALRDWVATHYLRKSGPDRPPASDNIDLFAALEPLLDMPKIERLFEEDRKKNPALDQWLSERFLSSYTIEDFRQYPPESLGGMYYKFITDGGFEIEFLRRDNIRCHYDFYKQRHYQVHDFEHYVTGGQVNAIGELIPYWVNLTNVFKVLSPELAGELSLKYVFSAVRVMLRSMLHYPETWPTVVEAIRHSIRVGQASEPIFMFKYEDVFHLPLEEARAALGVREACEVDTSAASEIFEDALSVATMAMAGGR